MKITLKMKSEEFVTLLQEGVKIPPNVKVELTDMKEPITPENVASLVIPVMQGMPELADLPVSELTSVPLGKLRRDNRRCFGVCRFKDGGPIMVVYSPIDDLQATMSKLREAFPEAVIERDPVFALREQPPYHIIRFQKGFQGDKVEFWRRLVSDEVQQRYNEEQTMLIIKNLRPEGEGCDIDRSPGVRLVVSEEGDPALSELGPGPGDVRRIDLSQTILTPEWVRIAAATLYHEYLHALGFLRHDSEFRALERLWPDEEARGGTPTEAKKHSLRKTYFETVTEPRYHADMQAFGSR